MAISSVASRWAGVSSPARPPMQIPSNGKRGDRPGRSRPEIRIQATLDDPEDGLILAAVCGQRSLGPSVGAVGGLGHDGVRRTGEHGLIEGHRDVRAERLLDRRRQFRGEPVERTVEVAPKGDPVVIHDPQIAERDDLEPTRIGQDRPVPVHEPMETAEPRDPLVPGAQVEVVRVGQDDRRARGPQVIRCQCLDRGVRAHGHELRCLHDPMGQGQPAGPRPRRSIRGRRRGRLEARRCAGMRSSHAPGGPGSGTGAGGSHRPGMPGSVPRGGGIS